MNLEKKTMMTYHFNGKFSTIIDSSRKGETCFHIVLHSWHPELTEHKWVEKYDTKWGEKEAVRSTMLRTSLDDLSVIVYLNTLDEAIEIGRDIWKENFKGAMKQINIFFFDRSGPDRLAFSSDNFEVFKLKDRGTPF